MLQASESDWLHSERRDACPTEQPWRPDPSGVHRLARLEDALWAATSTTTPNGATYNASSIYAPHRTRPSATSGNARRESPSGGEYTVGLAFEVELVQRRFNRDDFADVSIERHGGTLGQHAVAPELAKRSSSRQPMDSSNAKREHLPRRRTVRYSGRARQARGIVSSGLSKRTRPRLRDEEHRCQRSLSLRQLE